MQTEAHERTTAAEASVHFLDAITATSFSVQPTNLLNLSSLHSILVPAFSMAIARALAAIITTAAAAAAADGTTFYLNSRPLNGF